MNFHLCLPARLNMVRKARNGGSVNPSTLFQIKRRIAEGRLKLFLHTTVQTEASEPVFERLEDVRFIVASTGGKLDFCKIPFLQPLLCSSWEEFFSLFLSLKGPDAGNLSGSRSGAERVGSKLNELLEEEWSLDNSAIDRDLNAKTSSHSKKVSHVKRNPKRQNKIYMGARDRRAGNIGGWFDSLKEIEA